MPDVQPDSAETAGLLQRIDRGDDEALGGLLHRHRDEVRSFVELHLDPRLRARLDPSDVVQETQLYAARHIGDYLERRPMPFRLWLRKTAYQRLLNMQRDERRQRRSVHREEALPDRSSLLVALPVLAGQTPSEQAAARETAERVSRAVAGLAEADREVLLMRHAEGMGYDEIACLLEVDAAAARKRYGRALIRLQRALSREGLLE
jgi:RNA polymerase sigma-70 factor (ECF subfamily)